VQKVQLKRIGLKMHFTVLESLQRTILIETVVLFSMQ